jgi:activating signal cointegrator complex subunit 3
LYVHDEVEILHMESFSISKKNVLEKYPIDINFFIPYKNTSNKKYLLVVTSDRWVDSEELIEINLSDLKIDVDRMDYTKLLDLHPLPKTALKNSEFESIYKFKYFNPIQTQTFHALYHSDNNVLIGAPTGSGKTILAELGMLRIFRNSPEKKIVYIAPLKALAKERLQDWKVRLEESELKKNVIELTGDYTPDFETLLHADLVITTPEKWDGISRNWQNRSYVTQVGLIIFDEIHLLGQDRGPVLEVIVSRMNYIARKLENPIRMIGLSTAMANGSDVANWFGVKRNHFYNFKPHVRPVPTTIFFQGFPERHYCPRMATMNKPAYIAIKQHSDNKPVLVKNKLNRILNLNKI